MTLALFTTQLGTVSETFIRRHVEDLMPGETVAVARASSHPLGGRWEAPCSVLFLDREAHRLQARIARRAGGSLQRQHEAAIERFLRRHGVDLVLGEYLDQFVDFVPLLDRMGLPYVVQGHGIDVSAALRRPGMAERYGAFASARAILTRCEFHRRRLLGLGLSAERVLVNPGGIDVPDRVPARSPAAAKRFLAIGRMVPKKGPIYTLEAFRRAVTSDPEIRLDYLGDGELGAAVRQFVDAAGLSDRVRLHGGAGEDVKTRLLADCGVFVQHSLTDPATGDEEGLPAAIQEAMAHGLAVVSTRHSGIPEAVQDGASGWLVGERDVEGMSEAMLRAASGAAADFGARGRAHALAAFTWEGERARLLSALGRGASERAPRVTRGAAA